MQHHFSKVNDERLVILIVDDSELIMEKMIGLLEDKDHIRIIIQASSYPEAALLIDEIQPDIVLMDIVLRERTGIELLRSMHDKYRGSMLPVILTNHAGPHYRDACRKLGAHYFFDKSNEFEQVPVLIYEIYTRDKNNLTQQPPPGHVHFEVNHRNENQ
ncbi:MAG: response regulator transcription factor [Bacteroidota bacterium]|nr:response regulator transcription factor [Bacteroidota bacterium]MDP4217650.1 response regulator transcription factor [Bacteroidota bacterium]MDP4245568.1 response regulator transcription factor [Bacteroidota bacterium]MDP4255756.1 response regulator transcription factor [Bacteroidota bacterium]MDP4257337.1 response regulator transcription factor [Bacteroidota bacterium]